MSTPNERQQLPEPHSINAGRNATEPVGRNSFARLAKLFCPKGVIGEPPVATVSRCAHRLIDRTTGKDYSADELLAQKKILEALGYDSMLSFANALNAGEVHVNAANVTTALQALDETQLAAVVEALGIGGVTLENLAYIFQSGNAEDPVSLASIKSALDVPFKRLNLIAETPSGVEISIQLDGVDVTFPNRKPGGTQIYGFYDPRVSYGTVTILNAEFANIYSLNLGNLTTAYLSFYNCPAPNHTLWPIGLSSVNFTLYPFGCDAPDFSNVPLATISVSHSLVEFNFAGCATSLVELSLQYTTPMSFMVPMTKLYGLSLTQSSIASGLEYLSNLQSLSLADVTAEQQNLLIQALYNAAVANAFTNGFFTSDLRPTNELDGIQALDLIEELAEAPYYYSVS